MKFSIMSLVAAATFAIAQTPGFDAISSPTQDQTLQAGSSFEIVWDPASQMGDVTITLLQGASPSTLQLGPVIASSIDNQGGKLVWSPVPESQFATYGFKISLDSNPATFQYSFPFHIAGKAAISSAVPSSAAPSSSVTFPTVVPPSTNGPTTTDCTTSTPTVVSSTDCATSTPSYPTTISAPSYPAYPTTVPAYQPTYTAGNGTWITSGTGCATTSAPTRTPSIPTPQGTATRFGASGFAAFIGLLLAFAH